jgi:Uncharacterised conserved protein
MRASGDDSVGKFELMTRGSVNVSLRVTGYDSQAAAALERVKATYPDADDVSQGSGLHISLTRPSMLPAHLEQPIFAELVALFESTEAFDAYTHGYIDAFVTDRDGVAFGVTIDQDVSHALMRLLSLVNGIVLKFGMLPFHAEPRTHITVGVLPAAISHNLRDSPEMTGPSGSRFMPKLLASPEAAGCSVCSSVSIRVGQTTRVIHLIEN